MLTEQLKAKGVKSVTVDDIEYFDVRDIKENYPEFKVDTAKIVYVKEVALVKASDVHSVTKFDNMIKQVFSEKKKKS